LNPGLNLATLWAVAFVAVPAMAETTVPAQGAAPAADCELHAWPAGNVRVIDAHWLGPGHRGLGFPLDDWIGSIRRPPVLPRNLLSTADQAKMMREANLAGLLALDGYRVIVHDNSLDSNAVRTAITRIESSTAPCYAELMADGVVLETGYGKGLVLTTSWRFRRFENEQSAMRSFSSFSSFSRQPLRLFPSDGDHPEQARPAIAELYAAYRQDIVLFAEFVRQPVKRKKPR
jgi:hypothetical protein